MNCYCGSALDFTQCCEPFINFSRFPQTAEQLMRSRYSAFCDNQADYLVATHWPIDPSSKSTIQKTIDSTQWLGLKVVTNITSDKNHRSASVEFVAFFKENEIQQLHELSQFRIIDDRWYYVDGKQLPPLKMGRNDLCFCASGKKYKKCHGGKVS